MGWPTGCCELGWLATFGQHGHELWGDDAATKMAEPTRAGASAVGGRGEIIFLGEIL